MAGHINFLGICCSCNKYVYTMTTYLFCIHSYNILKFCIAYATGWMTEELGADSREEIFLSPVAPRPSLGPILCPECHLCALCCLTCLFVVIVPSCLFLGLDPWQCSGQGMKLTTDLQVVPQLQMRTCTSTTSYPCSRPISVVLRRFAAMELRQYWRLRSTQKL